MILNNILIIDKANINYTGAKIRNYNLAIEFSKRGKKVYILATNKLEIFENGKKVFKKKINLFEFFVIFLKQYDFWLCDIVLFSLFFKKNLFFTLHDTKEWMKYGRGGLLKKILLYIIIKKSKICITLSKKLKNFFSKKYNKKFYIIKNGLSPQWKKLNKKRKIKEKYLIYVSNYTKHKNHLSLINIQQQLNYKIVLVGKPLGVDGEKIYNELKKKKNFKFIFNPSTSELQSLVNYSEFVLFPSKLEGFGLPIIEGLSQEKSVLVDKDLKYQLPMFLKCKKLFFHDFSKMIEFGTIKKILAKKTCKDCIYKDYEWQQSVKDFEKIIKKVL